MFRIRTLLLCIQSCIKISIAMILFLEENLLAWNLLNSVMSVGSAKAGMNNFLNLLFLNLVKMVRTMFTSILTSKSSSPVSLTFRILRLNTKLWYLHEDTDIFLLGMACSSLILLQVAQIKVLVKRYLLI